MPGRTKRNADQTADTSQPSPTMSGADTANGERDVLDDTATATGPSIAASAGADASASSTVPVTFHRIAHEAGMVALVGDFNGWDPTTHPMVRDGEVFAITVELPAGTRQRYRFVVDGHHWEEDSTAVMHEENPYGGHDSVVDLGDRVPPAGRV